MEVISDTGTLAETMISQDNITSFITLAASNAYLGRSQCVAAAYGNLTAFRVASDHSEFDPCCWYFAIAGVPDKLTKEMTNGGHLDILIEMKKRGFPIPNAPGQAMVMVEALKLGHNKCVLYLLSECGFMQIGR